MRLRRNRNSAAPATLNDRGEGRYALSGDLVFENVARVLEQGEAAFGDRPLTIIDLADVGLVDSAGLALLLEWAVAARAAERVVSYRNLPAGAASLAGISDVSALLVGTDSAA
jgi:phospholipid transport system transporter-binding protein